MLLLALKRQVFVQTFCCWKTLLNKSGCGTGTGTGTGTETKTFPKKVGTGTGTAINHYRTGYGFTTLERTARKLECVLKLLRGVRRRGCISCCMGRCREIFQWLFCHFHYGRREKLWREIWKGWELYLVGMRGYFLPPPCVLSLFPLLFRRTSIIIPFSVRFSVLKSAKCERHLYSRTH